MKPNLSDILAILGLGLYLSGMVASTIRILYLTCSKNNRYTNGFLATILAVFALAYASIVMLDIPSSRTVLTNQVEDVPLSSAVRTLVFGAWMWVLHSFLYLPTRGGSK